MRLRRFTDPLAYIHNRWISPSHRVTINHPEFSRGQYHDTDCIMMFAMFQLLVDFVELECGTFGLCGVYPFEHSRWQRMYRVMGDIPILGWFVPPSRNALRGLHHLRWAMKLPDMPSQVEHAKAVFRLYKFWKHERPARPDPFDDAEGFTDEEEGRGKKFGDWSPRYSEFLKRAGELEDKYNQEDQEYLHMLIEIRCGLWT